MKRETVICENNDKEYKVHDEVQHVCNELQVENINTLQQDLHECFVMRLLIANDLTDVMATIAKNIQKSCKLLIATRHSSPSTYSL